MRIFRYIISGMILMASLMIPGPFSVHAGQNRVLFDEGHGQRFLVEGNSPLDLSGLSALFQDEGLLVKTSSGEITDKVLAEADALVISGAFAPFSPSETAAIINFIERGGRLCVMLHIGLPVAGLLSKLNVYISKGVVREGENIIEQQETDYYVTASPEHELMEGIERFRVFGGWALVSDNEHAEIIAQTSAKSWIDANMNNKRDAEEKSRPLGLAIAGKLGAGRFIIFGDDAIFQNRFLSEENSKLGKNVARWLKGEKSTPPADRVYM